MNDIPLGRSRDLRTDETRQRYIEEVKKRDETGSAKHFTYNLDEESILKEFTHWVVIPNKFPYDLIAEDHHLLVPRRTFSELSDATEEEYKELQEIKLTLGNDYSFLLESLHKQATVARHLHFHLIKLKEKPCAG